MALGPRGTGTVPHTVEPDAVRELASARWYGRANRLSPQDPVPWEIIDQVSEAARKP